MDEETGLPLSLTEEQLPEVEVFFAAISAKTGAGRQEMTVTGAGKLSLLRTRAYDQPEELRDANVPGQLVLALLATLEASGFFGLGDDYPADDPAAGAYLLRVTLPDGRMKQTRVELRPDAPPPAAFARSMGALALVARVSLPDAMRERFLSAI